MPSYDYFCEANGRTVEVWHRMSDSISSWGDVCAKADIDPGQTPARTAVKRLITGGNIIGGEKSGGDFNPGPGGHSCGRGMCGCG